MEGDEWLREATAAFVELYGPISFYFDQSGVDHDAVDDWYCEKLGAWIVAWGKARDAIAAAKGEPDAAHSDD